MLNILTVDLEDYFMVSAFEDVVKREDWENYESRIEKNTYHLLSILNDSSIKSRSTAALQDCTTSPLKNSSLRTPHHLNLSPHALRFTKDDLPSPPCAMRSAPCESPKGTFFVLGWIAERYPDLVRRIQNEGHEIACHGYAHRLVYTQSRDEFRQDVKRAKSILEDITGSGVIGYRAPSYSITNKSQWAFEVLMEEGFKYDSSVFPIRHDFYGMPNAPRFPFVVSLNGNSNAEFSVLNFELKSSRNSPLDTRHSQLAVNNSLPHSLINSSSKVSTPPVGINPNSPLRTQHYLIEFPLSTVRLLGANFPISGGGYFRLLPYSLIKYGLKSVNGRENKPFIFYIHPWELDFEQPKIREVRLRSRFRHYVNLDKTESRFRKLLKDFQFSTVRQLLTQNA